MKKTLYFIFTVLFLLLFLIISGCNEQVIEEETEEKYSILGYWKSSYGDGFEVIDSTTDVFKQYDNAAKDLSFEGDIVSTLSTDSSGYITVLITNSGTWGKTVGEYYRIHFKNLLGDTVQEACAWKSGGQSTCVTQAAAEAEFTVSNGYFGFYPDYVRQ